MTSTLTAPQRGLRPLVGPPGSNRAAMPLPGPLAKVAEAARQNQILALQALQAAAVASAGSSSSSSSPPGSPPFAAAGTSGGRAAVASAKRGRKFQAIRAPSSSSSSPGSSSPGRSGSSSKLVPMITTTVPHWAPEGSHPLIDPNSGRRSEIYSLTNDRYPGAPGTALAKAREAQQKAILAAKKEAAKKLASKAELEHLGVKGLGKKRKSSSPYATINSATAGSSSTSVTAVAGTGDKGGTAMSRESSTASRSRSTRAAANAVASTSVAEASSSRSRRPTSRSNSPVPLTSNTGTGRRSGARGAISSAVAEEDASSKSSPSHHATRSSPSRGTSPPDGTLKAPHNGLSSTAPFQSSPLAANSLTMESTQDGDASEAAEESSDKKAAAPGSEVQTLPARGTSLKRKASTLSQEILADGEADEEAVSKDDDSSKKTKHEAADGDRSKRKTSPSSMSSSRRTSPRTKDKTLVPLADGSSDATLNRYGSLADDASADAAKSRLSPLSLEHAGAATSADASKSASKRVSRSRRGGAKSDAEGEEVRDEDLGGSAGK